MGLMKLDEGMPRLLPNISYDWEALYDSPAFLALQDVIGHLTDHYMEAVSAEQEASPPKHGQIFRLGRSVSPIWFRKSALSYWCIDNWNVLRTSSKRNLAKINVRGPRVA